MKPRREEEEEQKENDEGEGRVRSENDRGIKSITRIRTREMKK